MAGRRKTTGSPRHSLPGPEDIFRSVLPNGITVLGRANFNSPSVVISGYTPAGSLFEADEKLGLADFTAAALMRGTHKHDFDSLYGALEAVGASLGFDSGLHTTGFHGRALVEDLPLLLNLLSETLRQPSFPPTELEKLRSQLLTGLSIRNQDTSDMAEMAFDELLFRDHPYARPEDGHPATVKAITREDIVEHHRRCFGPRRMVIALVGAVEPRKAAAAVEKVLGDWKNPDQPEEPRLPEFKPLNKTVERRVSIPGKSQTDIVVGSSGPARTDPDYLAASLGNSVLGQFGMMGRVGDVVRERSGLAYYAYSNLSAGVGPGSWTVSAGVNPTNVDKAVDLIVKELRRFVKDGVTRRELADSQANFVGRLPLSMESNGGVAGALINIERYHLGLDYYLRYPGLVKAVTTADVSEAARKYIDADRLAIATAGS